MTRLRLFAAGLLMLVPAARGMSAQQAVPVRDLAPADVRSDGRFGAILGIRQLSGGNVLVNDAGRRQLIVLDSTLTKRTIVIDSASGSAGSYGPRGVPLIPYLNDSTLFVDLVSQSLLVIDPSGRIARVTAAPRPSDVPLLASSASGVDNRGRLIYRGRTAAAFSWSTGGATGGHEAGSHDAGAARGADVAQQTDSAPVVRADFDTRQVDTVARVRQPSGTTTSMAHVANAPATMKVTINPLVTVDEWAVLSDGSIAIVRGHDYSIDWIRPDGSVGSTPKLPFDWKRLTDSDKQALVDSARAAQVAARTQAAADARNLPSASSSAPRMPDAGGGWSGGAGMNHESHAGTDGAPPAAFGPGATIKADVGFVPLSQIADYYPAIRPGAVRADLDGHLWILPTTSGHSKAGELVYDVVNTRGELVERVRVPAGRSIVGFGREGIVYLVSGDKTAGFLLERTRLGGRSRATQ